MDYYVGIDIGGTNIKYGLLSENGEIINSSKVKTLEKKEEIIGTLQNIIEGYKADYKIKAVGVSAPGVIEENGFMTTAGAIFELYGVNLKDVLEEKVKIPVFIENDANSAALAEKWLGAGKDKKHFLCMVVGTGIGGAIVINNEIYIGAHATAGEFGFMQVEPWNPDSRLASLSLTASVHSALVEKYTEQSPDNKDLNGEEIFKLGKAGDELALKLLDTFYDRLSKGLFNLITSFDPEVVLIGGAISAEPEFITELQNRILKIQSAHRDMANMKLATVEACKFQNNAGIIGGVYKAIKSLNI